MNTLKQYDKYIKYPLPLNKSLIDWESEYMKYGGKQLIEILEKEISLEEIINKRSELKINDSQVDRLCSWINEANADSVKLKEIKGYHLSSAVSFFYRGHGILNELYKIIDLTPIFEGDKFKSRFSFIRYESFKNEFGYIVVPKINEDNWSNRKDKISNYDRNLIENKYLFYTKNLEPLEDEEMQKNLINAYKIIRLLTD